MAPKDRFYGGTHSYKDRSNAAIKIHNDGFPAFVEEVLSFFCFYGILLIIKQLYTKLGIQVSHKEASVLNTWKQSAEKRRNAETVKKKHLECSLLIDGGGHWPLLHS